MDHRYDEPAEEKEASGHTRFLIRARSLAHRYLLPIFACPVAFMVLIAFIEFGC